MFSVVLSFEGVVLFVGAKVQSAFFTRNRKADFLTLKVKVCFIECVGGDFIPFPVVWLK